MLIPAHIALHRQYFAEHYTEELPKLGALSPILTPMAILVNFYFYYCCFKKTAGPKSHVTASLIGFFVAAGIFAGLELGFPKDDPKDQILANKDATHSHWHFLVHTIVLALMMLASKDVTDEAAAPAKIMATAVPSSPKHTTLSPSRRQAKDGCEPKAFNKAAWPHVKAA